MTAGPDGDGPAGAPRPILGLTPKALAGVFALVVLIVGVPAAFYAYAGQTDVALGLIGMFALMVVVTGYALREAVKIQREMDGTDGSER